MPETAPEDRSKGKELIDQLIEFTGMPAKTIKRELQEILEKRNLDLNDLTVDQLRSVVAAYMRQIMGSLLDRSQSKNPEN